MACFCACLILVKCLKFKASHRPSGTKPAPKLTCSRKMLLCNFVFSHQEKKSFISIWIGSYVVFFGLSLLSLVMSFFHYFVHPNYQLSTLINIGESFSTGCDVQMWIQPRYILTAMYIVESRVEPIRICV